MASRKHPTSSRPPQPARDSAIVPGPLELSESAQRLHDDVSSQWDLTPPVAALLRLVAEAMTKAEALEAVTSREGMTIGDQKGAAKPHPAALLARDYRAQAASGLQRILSHLEK